MNDTTKTVRATMQEASDALILAREGARARGDRVSAALASLVIFELEECMRELPYEPAPATAAKTEPAPAAEPERPKRGRPRGSKSKKPTEHVTVTVRENEDGTFASERQVTIPGAEHANSAAHASEAAS